MRFKWSVGLLAAAFCTLTGCHLPGKPKPGAVALRPDQVTDFQVLYRQNCAGCHGANGKGGAAVALADPVYLTYAGRANVLAATTNGIPGSLMPAFAKSAGGDLTDRQVNLLTEGILHWAGASPNANYPVPVYQSLATGDASRGVELYRTNCLRCHAPGRGSVLDPVYLGLISNGGLRTILVVGKPQEGMPDWRGYPSGALTDQQLADLVSFLVAHRRTGDNVVPGNTSEADRKAATP